MGEYIVDFAAHNIDAAMALCDGVHGEIVRCKDCTYSLNHMYNNGPEYLTCSYFDSEYAEVEPDGFCAWAERKEQ